jgi:hypothetical protein
VRESPGRQELRLAGVFSRSSPALIANECSSCMNRILYCKAGRVWLIMTEHSGNNSKTTRATSVSRRRTRLRLLPVLHRGGTTLAAYSQAVCTRLYGYGYGYGHGYGYGGMWMH